MLVTAKKVTIEGKSIIDGVHVANFVAAINSANPEEMTLSTVRVNKAAYKEHRINVRLDEAEFEDYAYSVQDAMLADLHESLAEAIESQPEISPESQPV